MKEVEMLYPQQMFKCCLNDLGEFENVRLLLYNFRTKYSYYVGMLYTVILFAESFKLLRTSNAVNCVIY